MSRPWTDTHTLERREVFFESAGPQYGILVQILVWPFDFVYRVEFLRQNASKIQRSAITHSRSWKMIVNDLRLQFQLFVADCACLHCLCEINVIE